MDWLQRVNGAKAKNLCLNCLRAGHFLTNCSSKQNCLKCNKRHHTLLHKASVNIENDQNINQSILRPSSSSQVGHICDIPMPESTIPAVAVNEQEDSSTIQTYNASEPKCQTLLATALVKVVSPSSGIEQVVRALIDPGSQMSFIAEAIVQDIHLKKEYVGANIYGVGQQPIGQVSYKAGFIIRTLDDSCSLNSSALVLKKLTHLLPNESIPVTDWGHLRGLQLADPRYFKSSKVDLLLGADIYGQILLDGVKTGPEGSPIAQRTIFGWVLTGGTQCSRPTNYAVSNFHLYANLETQLKRFWEIESVSSDIIYTSEEQQCEDHFCQTHRRLSDGRYQVDLPLIEDKANFELGKSRSIAISRLLSLERQFKKKPDIKEPYDKCVQEYLEMGHMKRVYTFEDFFKQRKKTEDIYSCCYLPHHCVIKENSTTTKLRVVFDASRPTSSGVSLNDKMLKGPVIQDELATILLRWRKYRIAFSADLEKMYRQIQVNPAQADLQRIVWRTSPESKIQDYHLTTVTFGTKSAPYLATRVLKQLAMDEKRNYPLASEKVLEDFYVDDLLSGTDTIESAISIQGQLVKLMKSGGFTLRKWTSNSEELLRTIPEEDCEANVPLHLHSEETFRTLGIQWNPHTDCLSYTIDIHDNIAQKWTKRLILSEIAKIFDPLGWLAPVIIIAKIFLQKLWLSGLDWDKEVSPDLKSEWEKYRNNLVNIKYIQVQRWLYCSSNIASIEIHGFSDSSLKAYAAVVYICVTDGSGQKFVSLLTSKSKVAPIKTISLPRLELCGATLLAKLIIYIRKALKLKMDFTIKTWTDSQIVIAWLKGHPSKWTSFVANRVSEIHQTLGQNTWSFVASKDNPADCASRGLYPDELRDHELWWQGPEWLWKTSEYWPQVDHRTETDIERRKIVHQVINLNIYNKCEFWDTVEAKYSCFSKLIRITAYVLRFVNNTRPSATRENAKFLKSIELKNALFLWVTIIQKKHFQQEIFSLKQDKPVPDKSRLRKLTPFLDERGMLRVGGRLRYANLSFNEKHPVILPDKCLFVKLLIEKTHQDTLHGGSQLMRTVLAKTYWILNARNTVRNFIHKCLVCYRQKATTRSQLMGDLPRSRVQMSRPFSHTGVDYCGPFELKTYKSRNSKRYKAYISLFVCMSTKAIHLEVVTDLTAEGFLAAYRRFSSRRGRCAEVYCDCGTNFVGANKMLLKQYSQMLGQLNFDIASIFEGEGVKFKFIPPGSPHFGGLWEAGVKSTKAHLFKILGATTLTYEEFNTVIVQIEACLNSRPL